MITYYLIIFLLEILPTYIVVLVFALIPAYILWFVLRKVLRRIDPRAILAICLVVSLTTGYIAAHRIAGYNVTVDYLTNINDQSIQLTGKGLSKDEQDAYKNELSNSGKFKKLVLTSALKMVFVPFVLVLFIMWFSVRKTIRSRLLQGASIGN